MKVENEKVHGKQFTLARLTVGQTYETSFAITADLIEGFSRVTGDYNPIHLDEDYARQTIFEKRVAQGMLGRAAVRRFGVSISGYRNRLPLSDVKVSQTRLYWR